MRKPSRISMVATAGVAALAVAAAVGITLGTGGGTPSSVLAADSTPATTAPFGTPTIDAVADPVWDSAPTIHIESSSAAITADDKFMWDSRYLYALVSVNDSTPVATANPSFCNYNKNNCNDGVDFWVNWIDSPAAQFDDFTGAYIAVNRGGAVSGSTETSDVSGVRSKVVSTDTGYTVEVAIPWSGAERPGSPFGINTSINDYTVVDAKRTAYITWDTVHQYWQNPAGVPTVAPTGGNGNGQILGNTDDFSAVLGRTSYLPVWPDLAGDGVTYTVDDPSIAYVDSAGGVTGLAVGSTGVTVKKDGLPDAHLTVRVAQPAGADGFIASTFTLPFTPLRSGADVSQSLAGFWRGTAPTSYTKVAGDDWLSLSADGLVTGTAPTPLPDHPGVIEAQATNGTTTSTIELIVPLAEKGSGRFMVHQLTTAALQSGAAVQQPVAGLWSSPAAATFTKVSGDDWLKLSANGVITGTPPKGFRSPAGVIKIQGSDGAAADTITVQVPVAYPGVPPQITAASWNLWDNGANVNDALAKELVAITSSGLDVIGVQESGGAGAKALADALGWYSYQSTGDLGIVSAYPVSAVTEPTATVPAAGATLTVAGQTVRVWTAHLDESDATARGTQATAVVKALGPDLSRAARTPVVLLGDLAATPDSPAVRTLARTGLADAFALYNRGPGANSGATYSLVAAGGAKDRVDYVHYFGPLLTLGAESYYTGRPATDATGNQWPSDHAAAVGKFQLPPALPFHF